MTIDTNSAEYRRIYKALDIPDLPWYRKVLHLLLSSKEELKIERSKRKAFLEWRRYREGKKA